MGVMGESRIGMRDGGEGWVSVVGGQRSGMGVGLGKGWGGQGYTSHHPHTRHTYVLQTVNVKVEIWARINPLHCYGLHRITVHLTSIVRVWFSS